MNIVMTDAYVKWFDCLRDEIAKATITRRIEIIKDTGYFGDSKSVGDGITELRIHCGKGYRVYLTVRGMDIIIILGGGDKSSQQSDIKKAKILKKEVDNE